jgi:hypothetical protein
MGDAASTLQSRHLRTGNGVECSEPCFAAANARVGQTLFFFRIRPNILAEHRCDRSCFRGQDPFETWKSRRSGMMRTAFLTLAFAALLGGPALAQGVIVEHYDEDTGAVMTAPADAPPAVIEEEDGPVIVEEHAPPPERYEPPVFGWIMVRPENCGTFKYWNGESCVDARYDPED